ncbi:unnamed protein product, partial [Didymodactylos carnosus]
TTTEAAQQQQQPEDDEQPPPPYSAAISESTSSHLALLNTYVTSKLCYHPAPLANARVIKVTADRVAYQLDLWTLMEQRRFKKCEKPYNNEAYPAELLKGLFEYPLEQPATILTKKYKQRWNLEQTQYKTHCPNCGGAGIVTCSSCGGRRMKDCYACTAFLESFELPSCSAVSSIPDRLFFSFQKEAQDQEAIVA